MLALAPAPIAFFVGKDLGSTNRAIDALARNPEAGQSQLFVFIDGPKDATSRSLAERVKAFCNNDKRFASLVLIERDKYLGHAESVFMGVSEVVKSHGKVIVIEEDVVVVPAFLSYMNDALNRYQNIERVMYVSGFMFPISVTKPTASVFLPVATGRAWATWARVWTKFEFHPQNTDMLRDKSLRRVFDMGGSHPFFSKLKAEINGKMDSLKNRLYFHMFQNNGLALYPSTSLVVRTDSGMREDALQDVADPDSRFTSPRVDHFPELISANQEILQSVVNYLHGGTPRRLITAGWMWARFGGAARRISSWFKMRQAMSQAIFGHGTVFHAESKIYNGLNDKRAIQVGQYSHVHGTLLLFGHGGRIVIGDYCYIGDGTRIWSSCSVQIGHRVLIAHDSFIVDNTTHPMDAVERHTNFKEIITSGLPKAVELRDRPVVIEDDAWLGCMSIVLAGVTIGRGAIVAAGAVVTKNVPPWTVVAGNPATIIKRLAAPLD